MILPFASGIPFWLGLLLAGLGVMVLGVSKSGFGGGAGIVAVPLFAIAFGAKAGTAILLPVLIAADLFSVRHYWRQWEWRVLRLLVPGTVVGIAIGSVVLWWLVSAGGRGGTAEALNLLTGVVSVLYVGLDLVRQKFAPQWYFKPTPTTGTAAGLSVGVISTLAHAAGPVAAIFLLNQGLPRMAFMGTTVIYFFGINTVKLIPYTVIPGMLDGRAVVTGLMYLPLVPVGTWVGKRISERLSEKVFRNVILGVTLATGLQLVAEYVTGVKLAEWIAGYGG